METTQPQPIKDAKLTLLEYVENNPVAAVVQALVIGFAVGMLVRLLEGSREKEPAIDVKRKPTLEDAKFHLGSLVLPFLWPAWRTAKEVSGKSAKTVRETVKQVKKSDLPKKGQKKLKKAEAWAEKEAERLAALGKKKAKEAGSWAEREGERLVELGKKAAEEVEEWVEDEAEHLTELGKKKVKDVEEWVENEVLPAAETGWKKLAKLLRL